jgi:hypothetical protein
VLRVSTVRVAARIWRRVWLGWIVVGACLVAGLGASAAPASHQANPEELWRAFPLEQQPEAGGGGAPAQAPAPPRRRAGAPSLAAREPPPGPPWIELGFVAAAGALLALVAVSLRARGVSVVLGVVPRAHGPATTQAGPRTRRTATSTRGQAAAARPGPVCQIRWSARSACFYAVPAGVDGDEQRVVRSQRLEGGQPSPPEQTSEARAAVRQLAKELRDRGWSPLRAKGADFDEWQWYARRFRWPAEAKALEEDRS